MSDLIYRLKTEYKNEYDIKADQLPYKPPRIYHGGNSFDLNKRWYVYYDYWHAPSESYKRQAPIYLDFHKYKEKSERLKRMNVAVKVLTKLLKDGWSPYFNLVNESNSYYCTSSIDFALNLKLVSLADSTAADYKQRIGRFTDWLDAKGLSRLPIAEITKKNIIDYLNHVHLNSSNRNRNNTLAVLSSIFSALESNDLIERNFIKSIDKLPTKPERNRSYNDSMVDDLFAYMDTHSPVLFLFIQLVSYNFLRNIEVCRLQMRDVDLNSRKLVVKAKNKAVKIKVIPEILINRIPQLPKPDHLLITPDMSGVWNATETNRRNYFSKEFKKIKYVFDLGNEYTIYSFRHTFISRLYNELKAKYTMTECLDRLMLITGHKTVKALYEYLREIDAELPEDWSEYLKKP